MKIRYRFVAKTFDDVFHLFEMDASLPPTIVHTGLLLTNVPNMPAPAGPDAEFANKIMRCVWDEAADTLYASLIPLHYATDSLDEVKQKLPSWEFMRTLQYGSVSDKGQVDLLND